MMRPAEESAEVPTKRQDSSEEMEQRSKPKKSRLRRSAGRQKMKDTWVHRLWRALRGQEEPLPRSNPRHWPNPTIEDLKERPNRVVSINKAQEFLFCDNFIKTSKYEVWSFVPKFLAMEFHPRKKIANLYFLGVSGMQAVPAITSTMGYPLLLMPLLFIVFIDMVFTIIEDASRHKADAIANASKAFVLDKKTKSWAVKERWEVAVGDFVKVRNREEVPADMLVVGVHERYRPTCSGVCYLETKSLDGETNLKIRQVQKVLLGRVDEQRDLKSFEGRVIMEHPTKSIETFTGTLEVTLFPGMGANETDAKLSEVGYGGSSRGQRTTVREPITPDNLLLRGTVLRNTQWATGLVLSTGHDTKVMMSIAKAPEKGSHLNSRINTEIKGLAVMLFSFCLTGALGNTIWVATNQEFSEEVLQWDPEMVAEFIVKFFYYLLLLYSFVPISLYVSQNFIRYFQSWFMDQDLDMYHEPTDTPSKVRTMNLNEDLGQASITHVFSDKTGTLTQNVMDFRKCTIGGKSYGKGMTEIGQAALKVQGVGLTADEIEAEEMAQKLAAPHVNFYDPALFQDLQAEVNHGGGKGPLTDFLTLLALCHTVIPEKPNDNDEIVLSASSPDEEALVLGAKYFGVEFAERINTKAVVHRTEMPAPLDPCGQPVKESYDILRILEFNSVRKRMSVVVRMPGGGVRVLSKGADTTMVPLLRDETPEELLTTTMAQLEGFALEGLRTLMLGCKDMSEEEYARWDEAYDAAINNLDEVVEQQAGRRNRIDDLMTEAEQGLTLMGGTAIEDKLQAGVGETIEKLIRGGVVVWVITGDKEETAINIGVACQLLWSEERMDRCIINTKTCPTGAAVKERLLQEFGLYSEDMAACSKGRRSCKPRCLVIDGPAFSLIEDAPLTSLHGTLEGEESLASLAMKSPPVHNFERPMSQALRAGTNASAGQETPSRLIPAAAQGARWRRTRDRDRDRSSAGARGGRHAASVADAIEQKGDASFDVGVDVEKARATGRFPAMGGGRSRVGGAAPGPDGDLSLAGEEKPKYPDGPWYLGVSSEGGVGESKERGDGSEKEEDDGNQQREAMLVNGDILTAKEALLQFAGVCQAVVGCRMSPDQKRQLVSLIKDNNPDARTLAVGDGANDVPMIQAAHVGVGISGQEGLQAVNASDYALAQFRFLQKLLLCHGRFNYRRMSFASSYLFYKSVMSAVPIFLYAFWNGLSGQIFFEIVVNTVWAILFTGLPIIFLGIYDMDVLPETALRYPWLYRNGVDDELLTKRFFWGWIAQGVLESSWVTIPLMLLQTGGRSFNGGTPEVLMFGQGVFLAITVSVNMKVLFIQKRWHWLELALLTVSTGLFFTMSWVLSVATIVLSLDWEWFGVQDALFKDPNYWAVAAFGVIGVLMRDVAWKFFHRWWHPKLHHMLVEMEKGHLEDIDLPETLRNSYSLDDVVQEDTNYRMSRMRTQSMRLIENHRDLFLQALGPAGLDAPVSESGRAQVAPTGGLDVVEEESPRPRSLGSRMNSWSHLLGSGNRSHSFQGNLLHKGRSADSSPSRFNTLRNHTRAVTADDFPLPVFARHRSGDEEQEEAVAGARVGFAFSQDPRASAHEIRMILRNRAPDVQGLKRTRNISEPSIPSMPEDSLLTQTRTYHQGGGGAGLTGPPSSDVNQAGSGHPSFEGKRFDGRGKASSSPSAVSFDIPVPASDGKNGGSTATAAGWRKRTGT
ncbi:unnamed protein product [Ascophyllum nodosum]